MDQDIQSQPHLGYMSKDADFVQWYGDSQMTQSGTVSHKPDSMEEALWLIARHIRQLHHLHRTEAIPVPELL